MKLNTIEVKQMAEITTAACDHVGPYSEICGAFDKLMTWAAPLGLLKGKVEMIGIYHDDPALVAPEKLRSKACLVVTGNAATEGDVKPYTITGGKYLVVVAELTMTEFEEVWSKLYEILEEKGLECDNRDHYEWYLNNPEETPDAIWQVSFHVPVK